MAQRIATKLAMVDPPGFELFETRIGELIPLSDPTHVAPRPKLLAMSDEELLVAVRHPKNLDYVVIDTRTGKLHDGNGRVIELQRRAADPNSTIEAEMTIPVEHYVPDLSMFPDLA